MASTNNARKKAATKPQMKPVIPALPLSYMRRGSTRANPIQTIPHPDPEDMQPPAINTIGIDSAPSSPSTLEEHKVERDDATVVSQTPVQAAGKPSQPGES